MSLYGNVNIRNPTCSMRRCPWLNIVGIAPGLSVRRHLFRILSHQLMVHVGLYALFFEVSQATRAILRGLPVPIPSSPPTIVDPLSKICWEVQRKTKKPKPAISCQTVKTTLWRTVWHTACHYFTRYLDTRNHTMPNHSAMEFMTRLFWMLDFH